MFSEWKSHRAEKTTNKPEGKPSPPAQAAGMPPEDPRILRQRSARTAVLHAQLDLMAEKQDFSVFNSSLLLIVDDLF